MSNFRVWHIPQVPMEAFRVECDTIQEARLVEQALANYDIFQLNHNIKPDYCNAGGIQQRIDGMWEDMDEAEIEEMLEDV